MTAKELTRREAQRLLRYLPQVSPDDTDTYGMVMRNIELVLGLGNFCDDLDLALDEEDTPTVVPFSAPDIPDFRQDSDPAPEISLADLRAFLGKAKLDKNLDVTDILSEMGYVNLSGVPASRYAELLSKAKAKLGEE